MWADFRLMEDDLYHKGEQIDRYTVKLNEKSRRENITYVYVDEDLLQKLYKQAGMEIISIDKFMYTRKNCTIKNVWYQVVSKKIKH